MKKILILFFFVLFFDSVNAQTLQSFQKEKLSLNSFPYSINPVSKDAISKNSPSEALLLIFPFNPLIAVENSKVYFGLTKEVSFGTVKTGNVAVEYTYLFRDENRNHLRFSYNYEVLASGSDFAAFVASFGGGYFTDFNKKGFFPQASLNLLLVLYENVCAVPYVKGRYTFMTEKEQSNIFDFSLGFKTAFYF